MALGIYDGRSADRRSPLTANTPGGKRLSIANIFVAVIGAGCPDRAGCFLARTGGSERFRAVAATIAHLVERATVLPRARPLPSMSWATTDRDPGREPGTARADVLVRTALMTYR